MGFVRPSTKSDPSQGKIGIFFKLTSGQAAISRQLSSHADAPAACVFCWQQIFEKEGPDD
jgi:hypothetical protein